MTNLLLVPVDDAVVFPNMTITLPVPSTSAMRSA